MLSAKKRLLVLIAFLMVFALAPLGNSSVYAAKKSNPLKITGKTATVDYSELQDKAQTLAVSKVVTFKNKGKGKRTYSKVSGNKNITINKKTGKITVKKGLKRGTYKIKIKVKAAKTKKYKAGSKTVTAKVKVAWLKKTIYGTSCMKQNGIWFPAALGAGQYTTAQLRALGKSNDVDYLRKKINTVSDAVRFFRANGFIENGVDSIEDTLLKRRGSYESFCRAFCLLISDNMSDTGIVELLGSKQKETLCYCKKGNYYYGILPFNMRSESNITWVSDVKGGSYVSTSLTSVINSYKKNSLNLGTAKRTIISTYPATVDLPVYSKAEIRAMVQENLSLDAAAASISTISDAINYLMARGYTVGKFSWNPGLLYPNSDYFGEMNYLSPEAIGEEYINYPINWCVTLSAEFTYRYNAGSCGGTSNLMNRLLKDDFNEEGYVEYRTNQGGHVFNYFKRGDVYYFCDFAGTAFTEDPYSHLVYKTTDPKAFATYYRNMDPAYNDSNSEAYMINLFMTARNGENQLPCGFPEKFKERQLKPSGDVFSNIYPDVLEPGVNMTILFIRDGFTMEPRPLAPPEAWEYEVQYHNPVRDDDGNANYEGY